MAITHLNPPTLPASRAFSQAVAVDGASRLIFVGGQNGVGLDGKLVGADLTSQTEQALRNVLAALAAGGADQSHVVRLTIHLVAGVDVRAAFAASQAVWGMHATAISVLIVAGLAVPGALVEIDAIAAV